MTIPRKVALLSSVGALAFALAACTRHQEEGPAEKAGKAVDDAIRDAGKQMNNAAEKVDESMHKAGEQIGKAAEKTGEAVKDAGKKMQDQEEDEDSD